MSDSLYLAFSEIAFIYPVLMVNLQIFQKKKKFAEKMK